MSPRPQEMSNNAAELENWRKQASRLNAKAKGFGVVAKDDGPGASADATLAGINKVGLLAGWLAGWLVMAGW